MKKTLLLFTFILSFSVLAAHKNIVDIAAENGNFKTLVTVLELTGLDEVLRNNTNLTVFAPTDDAFAKIPSDTLGALLEDQELLKSILLYHVAKPTLSAEIVSKLNGIKTLSGKFITNKSSDGNVILNTSKVIAADIYGENGVIHVIDTVLVPTENTSLNEIVTAKNIDLNKYTGLWIEQYRFPNRFERGCFDVTAQYQLVRGMVSVRNVCIKANGKSKSSKGTAVVVNRETNAELKVSFVPLLQRWGVFAGDYNILAIDENYKNVLVGSKDRSFLWILSRSEDIDPQIFSDLRQKAESLGYNTERLIKTPSLK